MPAWTLRPAREADAEAIAAVNSESFEGYRDFAPEGWEPPKPGEEPGWVLDKLGLPSAWAMVAESEGEIVGHVAFTPATVGRRPTAEDGLAHFWMLFVRRSHQGTGLATELHAEAVREAARRGYTKMRLLTPAGQARARRFYEREGWDAVGGAFLVPALGLDVVEYRYALSR